MGNIKYISAKKGQTAIIIGIVLFHIILILLVYLLLFKTNVIDFEKIATLLCSEKIVANRTRAVLIKLAIYGFIFTPIIGIIVSIISPPEGRGSSSSSDSGNVYIYGVGYRGFHR